MSRVEPLLLFTCNRTLQAYGSCVRLISSSKRPGKPSKANPGQRQSMELMQDQSGEPLKVVIKTDQSPLVRDREGRQMGICAQP